MFTHADRLVDRKHRYIRLAVALLVAWLLTQSLGRFLGPTTNESGALTGADFAGLGRLPLAFEPNTGHEAKPGVGMSGAEAVLFTARGGGSAFYFTRSEVVISIASPVAPKPRASSTLSISSGKGNPHEAEARSSRSSSVRLAFVGANSEPQISPSTRLPGTVNYLLGNDPAKWRTNLPTYGGITYSGLYPGVDLRYEGTQRHLKGTYTVASGADPTIIRWRYDGADAVSVDAQGNLQIAIGDQGSGIGGQGPKLTEQAPVAWQEINGERIPVRVSYALAPDNSVGFAVGKYDPKHELVIDPTLSYSTFLGGSSADYGFAIAVDSQGSVYVTGSTGSTDFPVRNPIYPPSPNGDIFVTKINADATAIIYSSLIGGESSDVGFGIAVDGAGNAYVTGETWSTDFPTVNPFDPYRGAYQSDAFLLKVNPTGSALVYSTYLGGDGADTARDIAVDGDGSAYLTGHTLSINFPLANPFQGTINGYQDGFVTKFNPSGSALVFSTYLGGFSGIEYSNGIAIDSQRAVYVAGYTASTDFPLQNPIQPTNHGNDDTFITKFNPPGTSLAYSTYLGGSLNDNQYSGLAVDPAGNAYVTGYTGSTDFPVANAYQSILKGFDDVFVTKVNAAGTAWVYSTYLGGIFSDGHYHTDIAADAQGNAYVGGNTASSDFPLVNNFQTGNIDSADDGFVTKFSPSGQELVYSTRIGGNNGSHFYNLDHIYGLALDAGGNVYITGETNSPQYPTTNGVFQPIKSGNYDSFISKISAQAPNTPTPTVTGTPPTATPTPCNAGANYTVSQQSGVSIVPGTQDIGNHCEACVTPYTLPFPVRFYDRIFTSALIGNHGSVGFVANQNFSISQCLPATDPPMFNYAILPFWTEVRTDGYGITCPTGGCGIFTSVTGSAPNRTLHIEWRGSRFSNGNFGYVNFELRLFEGSPNFQVVYGQNYSSWENGATIGAQKDLGSMYAQYACDMPSITPGTSLTFSLPDCGPQPTSTLAPISTRTNTSTPAGTRTATPTRTVTLTATRTSTSTPTSTRTGTPSAIATATPTATVFVCQGRVAICHRTSNGTYRLMTVNCDNLAGHQGHGDIIPAPPGGCPLPQSRTPVFSDVPPDHTFYDDVMDLFEMGAISGYSDGTFQAGNNATRAQVAKIAVLAHRLEPSWSAEQHFSDVPPSDPFFGYIERAYVEGWVSGYGDGSFRPYNLVTRGQIAKISVEASGYELLVPRTATFTDVPVGSTYSTYVETAYANGMLAGYPDGTFRPNTPATRGQVCKIMILGT